MSISDLKSRMADLAGISSLTMGMDAGKMVYSLNGQNYEFDASASDAQIENTIRAALANPTDAAPVAATDPVSVPAAPAATPAPVAAPVASPASAAASAPIVAAHSVKELIASHKQNSSTMHDAKVSALAMALDRQNNMVSTAIDSVITRVEQQTQDFQDAMKDLTNEFGDL